MCFEEKPGRFDLILFICFVLLIEVYISYRNVDDHRLLCSLGGVGFALEDRDYRIWKRGPGFGSYIES